MIGNRIKELRMEKNIKQEDLARELSVSKSAIGMYERNEREPNNEITLKLSEFFNVSTDYLLGKTNIRKSEKSFKEQFGISQEEYMKLSDNAKNEIKNYIKYIKTQKNKDTN